MSDPARRAPVDRARLDRLGARFGAAFVVQMIDLFLAQGAERIEAAERAAGEGDANAVTSAAHAVKSSAANLGAMELSARAASIENAGRSGATSAELAPRVAELAGDFRNVRVALEAVKAELVV